MSREEEIKAIARRIWEKEGCLDGHDVEHWRAAEDIWERKQNSPNWQIVATIFSLAVPVGYGAAYLRELGFCNAFGIPPEFIQLNITTILIAITSGIGVLFFLFWIADLFYTLSQQRKLKGFGPIKRRISFDVLLLIVSGGLWALFPPLQYYWPLLVYLLFFILSAQFVSPLIAQRQVPGYINKLEAQDRMERETPILLDYLIERAGVAIVYIGILVVLFMASMFLVGYNEADTQIDYLIPSTHQESVVLRIYGNDLICAPFDIKTKEVEKTFFVIKLEDETRPQLRLVQVGPLKSPKIWTLQTQN